MVHVRLYFRPTDLGEHSATPRGALAGIADSEGLKPDLSFCFSRDLGPEIPASPAVESDVSAHGAGLWSSRRRVQWAVGRRNARLSDQLATKRGLVIPIFNLDL